MNYKILKEEKLSRLKRSIDVEIPERLNSARIAQLAQQFFENGFAKTFMNFYLPGETIGEGCYASANWKLKDCEIKIYL